MLVVRLKMIDLVFKNDVAGDGYRKEMLGISVGAAETAMRHRAPRQ